MTADRNARIEERAYHIWLAEGRPDGRHDEHWHRAERELSAESGQAPAVAKPVGADDSRGERQVPDEATAERPAAKPRARSSRPAAAGSGSRGARRPAGGLTLAADLPSATA